MQLFLAFVFTPDKTNERKLETYLKPKLNKFYSKIIFLENLPHERTWRINKISNLQFVDGNQRNPFAFNRLAFDEVVLDDQQRVIS
jgi:hypothetical protein